MYTKELNAPVVTADTTTVAFEQGVASVTVSQVGAYDTQTTLNVFVGLVPATTDISLFTGETLPGLQSNTSAVFKSADIPASAAGTYTYVDATLTQAIDYVGGQWTAVSLEFDVNYNVVVTAKDAFDNFGQVEGVIIASANIPSIPVDDGVDNTVVEITPENDPNAGRETIVGASLNIAFEPVTDPDTGVTTYVGTDTSGSGNDIVVTATENPLNPDAMVNDYSLDIGLIDDPIEVPTAA